MGVIKADRIGSVKQIAGKSRGQSDCSLPRQSGELATKVKGFFDCLLVYNLFHSIKDFTFLTISNDDTNSNRKLRRRK